MSKLSKPPSNIDIIADFGALIEKRPPLPTRIDDTSLLPHHKYDILEALYAELARPQSDNIIAMMKIAARSLKQFQDDVGSEPVEMFGIDISKLPTATTVDELRKEAKHMVTAQGKAADRFDRFNKLVQEDEKEIEAALDLADAKRSDPTIQKFDVHFPDGEVSPVILRIDDVEKWAKQTQATGRNIEAICDEEGFVIWPEKDGSRIFWS